VPTIIEMVNHTRLDCVLGSSTGMRAGLAAAIHHTSNRSVFGTVLVEQPLMQNVLADLAVESERRRSARCASPAPTTRRSPATRGAEPEARRQRGAQVLDHQARPGPSGSASSASRQRLRRESGLPRLFRESPLNSIWRAAATSSASTSCGRW